MLGGEPGAARASVLGLSQRQPEFFPGCEALNAELKTPAGAIPWTLSDDSHLFL